jgi:hypothetical protein
MTQTFVLSDDAPGRRFDGVGALSAGASSRLLLDYPEPERTRILDLLFSPNHGAALQILRVEIGSDINSTAGSEPSHMRTRDDLDHDRGYEWWIMREARRRNPRIALSGLAWGVPGWLDGGFWSRDTITYHLAWLDCARRHGLAIDYLGGWNESEDFDADWFVALKHALREAGHHAVKLIAADGWGEDLPERWKVADAMAADPAFYDAVDVVSVHYPCGQQFNGAPYDHGPSTPTAQGLGKPLWAGEQGSQRYDIGGAPLARAINRVYIDGRMTATVNWALTASFYTSIEGAGVGLLRAYEPWSGYYEPSLSVWVVAHTTQFAQPGWRYLDPACGYLEGGGSIVTLRDPATGHYSVVIETVDATEPQRVRFRLPHPRHADRHRSHARPGDAPRTGPEQASSVPSDRGSAQTGRDRPDAGIAGSATVHVWETDLRSDRYQDWFRQVGQVEPTSGEYEVVLPPGRLLTLTTTRGQGKAAWEPPARPRIFALPYRESFRDVAPKRSPRLFSDFNGAFEATPRPDGDGQCLAQTVTIRPLDWRYTVDTSPFTLLGDPMWWGDYAVSVDVRLDEAPFVDLLGRVDYVMRGSGGQTGYRLRLSRDHSWALLRTGPDRTEDTLAHGRLDVEPTRWYRLHLSFTGTTIVARVDDTTVATVDDDRHNRGQVGLLVGAWRRAQFGDLAIEPTAPAPTLLPQEEMRATATRADLGCEASNALDANPTSLWHASSSPEDPPASITLDLGRSRSVHSLLYTPRPDADLRGKLTAYRVLTSTDGTTFTEVASGTWPATAATKVVALAADHVRHVRLEGASPDGAAGAAELNVALAWE